MSYSYRTQRPRLFTENGQEMFIKVRDNVKRLLDVAGCFHSEKAWENVSGDSWDMIACLDRLVEMGELREIERISWSQYRIFESALRD